MNPIKALIIEDELLSARMLQRYLTQLNIKTVAVLASVKQSLRFFENHKESHIDLIFSDIHLTDGFCFEIFEKIQLQSTLVFITAHQKYAVHAFDFNAIGYLLKPLQKEDLEKVVAKYKNQRLANFNTINWQDLAKKMMDKDYKNRILVSAGLHLKSVFVMDMVCLYAENKAVYAFTFSSKNYLLDQNLQYWEDHLDPQIFFRTGRSYMINFYAIENVTAHTNARWKVTLKNYKYPIIIARERAKDFKKWLDR